MAQKPQVSSEERMRFKVAILRMLQRGRARAIPGWEIAEHLGQSNDRKVRLIIRELIASGTPIASSVSDPAGFFIIETRDEAEAYHNVLTARIHEAAERQRDFSRAVEQLLGEGQQLPMV